VSSRAPRISSTFAVSACAKIGTEAKEHYNKDTQHLRPFVETLFASAA
jgi:hypothetical protein